MNLKRIKLSASTILVGLFGMAVFMTSCMKDPNSPGVEYMPDMYRSPAIEPYVDYGVVGDNVYDSLRDIMSVRKPVKGTIPRGFQPTTLPAGNDGYAMADSLKNPVPYSKEVLAEGKEIYRKMCSHCHGEKGMGDGKVVTNGGFPPPPAYASGNSSRGGRMADLSAGKIYHTITFGLNMMGSHASQISPEDRWKIVHYVQELQGKKKEETKVEATAKAEAGETEVATEG